MRVKRRFQTNEEFLTWFESKIENALFGAFGFLFHFQFRRVKTCSRCRGRFVPFNKPKNLCGNCKEWIAKQEEEDESWLKE